MRITSRGQVTIPADLREKAGLQPDTEGECLLDGGGVRIVRVDLGDARHRGTRIVAHLRGRGDQMLSTDEIMALTGGD